MLDPITLFIISIVVLFLFVKLIKVSVKLVIVMGIILLLFRLGYIWGIDDLNSKLNLQRYLHEDANQTFTEGFEIFETNREDLAVINVNNIDEDVSVLIDKAIEKTIEEVGNFDVGTFVEKLEDLGLSEENIREVLTSLTSELEADE